MRDARVLEEDEPVDELEQELAGAPLRDPPLARGPPRDVVEEIPACCGRVDVCYGGGSGVSAHVVVRRGRGADVVVGGGAKVLGGFEVGDGAKVGSNAVVTKPVPAGATAVGNPARIIQAEADALREEAASKMGFSAYGVTQNDDPLSQAMRGLIDNAAGHEHQIALLWQAIEKLSCAKAPGLPADAAKTEHFEAQKLNDLMGK